MLVKLLRKYGPPFLIFILMGSTLLIGARWISVKNGVTISDIVSGNKPDAPIVNKPADKIYEDNDPFDTSDDVLSGNYVDGVYQNHDITSLRYPSVFENEFYDKIRIEEGKPTLTDQLIADIAFKIIFNLKIIGGTLHWNYRWENEGNTLLYTFKWISSANVSYIKSYRVHLEQNNV